MADAATLPAGSVTVDTVFHVISDHALTQRETGRWERLIEAQMAVLNESFAGTTAADAAATPFRFDLTKTHLHGQRRPGTTSPPGGPRPR